MEIFDSFPPHIRACLRDIAVNRGDIFELFGYITRRYDPLSLVRQLIDEDHNWHREAFQVDLGPTQTRAPNGDLYFPSRYRGKERDSR